ncbi:uncharacterized protein LOC111567307 [Amphiprion ocellaris]|uniref:uncharacterized protein LOC111567307 n=1 Tax=Amphiprion ocellaris TaxID=80972 RepID=UPI002410F8B0|nr:uncharacterized protein LOC111567307 [Amphiprion ocellaris]XP_035803067.2 uncharacterized protein LOC111567307 [Amphiprion ocellaris]XP_035803072.2 uncharacterized protein LOC111567307 [Amphiprion ocellaris]
MFSDSGAPVSGEQKAFKPHAPHFIPWLRSSLKPHHSSDLGLNGPYKSGSEARNSLTPLERAKGIGFFSIPGKERAKKAELRCNGVGMARMLPVVLRGHHILKQTKEPSAEINSGDGPQGNASSTPQENHTLVRNHLSLRRPQNNGASGRKYGPLVGPPPVPLPALLTEEKNCKAPALMEDRRGKAWDGNTSYHHRELRSSSWLSSDTQGLMEKQQSFSSSFSYINKHRKSSQSQRDLREPPVEGFTGPLNGVIFSTEVPHRALGCTTTLRGPRRPNSEWIAILGQNQTWVQPRPNKDGESVKKEAGCSRKVVQNQIKRVVDNLEQVLKALRDVHQEMKEVVQQIDYLTSSIDLNEEEQQEAGGDGAKPPSDSSYSSGSNSSEVTVGSSIQRPSEPENLPGTMESSGFLWRNHPCRSQSPVLATLSERSRTLRFTCSVGSPPRQGGLLQCSNNLPSRDLSPQRSLPVRPPTPGLSPLTVNLHPPGSPGSQPSSPAASSSSVRVSPLSPKPHPPPALSPSVIIETPQSPSAAGCPPTDWIKEQRAAGPPHPSAASAAKPPAAQGRRGRKPPPYPHHRLSEQTKKAKEPREAPPYPEKRRLLSTTV